jgi:cell wall-associated NlpC family hydrolase
MTSEPVQLVAIQQTLNNMQLAAVLPISNTALVAQGDSFATTLLQASRDLATPNPSPSAGEGLFVGYLDGGAGTPSFSFGNSAFPTYGRQAETSLPALISSQPGSGSVSGMTSASLGNANVMVSDGGSGSGQAVVKTAIALEGTPYVWGGSQPGGFDCSGLVQYVYGQLGVKLPRTSENQATVGAPVGTLSSAEPGDLLFFAGSDGTAAAPGHVGIYVGNGEMIDAPYTGTSVQAHSISTAGSLVAIRRVLAGE